jgi:hypothetical protein
MAKRELHTAVSAYTAATPLATAKPLNDEAIRAAQRTLGQRGRYSRPSTEGVEHWGARSATQSGLPCTKPADK